MFGYRTFAENLQWQTAQPRFEAALVSVFAAIALLLSALGLYAVLSYVVAERMRELGLRMAFGASRSNILGMVVQRALLLGVTGIIAGAIASILGRQIRQRSPVPSPASRSFDLRGGRVGVADSFSGRCTGTCPASRLRESHAHSCASTSFAVIWK